MEKVNAGGVLSWEYSGISLKVLEYFQGKYCDTSWKVPDYSYQFKFSSYLSNFISSVTPACLNALRTIVCSSGGRAVSPLLRSKYAFRPNVAISRFMNFRYWSGNIRFWKFVNPRAYMTDWLSR